jgi:hypothetical protein
MTAPKNAMYRWMKRATPAQKKALAKAAGSSVGQLKHLAAGRRGASAEHAQALAAASRTLHVRALYLDQRDICQACGQCPLVEQRKAPKKPKAAAQSK